MFIGLVSADPFPLRIVVLLCAIPDGTAQCCTSTRQAPQVCRRHRRLATCDSSAVRPCFPSRPEYARMTGEWRKAASVAATRQQRINPDIQGGYLSSARAAHILKSRLYAWQRNLRQNSCRYYRAKVQVTCCLRGILPSSRARVCCPWFLTPQFDTCRPECTARCRCTTHREACWALAAAGGLVVPLSFGRDSACDNFHQIASYTGARLCNTSERWQGKGG